MSHVGFLPFALVGSFMAGVIYFVHGTYNRAEWEELNESMVI